MVNNGTLASKKAQNDSLHDEIGVKKLEIFAQYFQCQIFERHKKSSTWPLSCFNFDLNLFISSPEIVSVIFGRG